ncbi:MAG: hypothetical protein RLZZ502_1886, partial [Pseudomonadota bacterium]
MLGCVASIPLQLEAATCIEQTCYPTPSAAFKAAKRGDTVRIDAQDIHGDVAVITASHLRIIGTPGKTRLFAAGKSAEGKGIWVIKGSNTSIEGIEFHQAEVPFHNAAAIRLEGGHLRVHRCRFIHNRTSIMAGKMPSAVVSITDTEIEGHPDTSRFSHNLYIGEIGRLIMRGVWSHKGNGGHLLKSRALFNDIQGNRFSDAPGEGGVSSYEVEFPSAGRVLFAGNVVEQSAQSANQIMLRYGAEFERTPNPGPHSIRILQNTFINHASGGLMLKFDPVPKLSSEIQANVFLGAGMENKMGNFRSAGHRPPESLPAAERAYAQFRYV